MLFSATGFYFASNPNNTSPLQLGRPGFSLLAWPSRQFTLATFCSGASRPQRVFCSAVSATPHTSKPQMYLSLSVPARDLTNVLLKGLAVLRGEDMDSLQVLVCVREHVLRIHRTARDPIGMDGMMGSPAWSGLACLPPLPNPHRQPNPPIL